MTASICQRPMSGVRELLDRARAGELGPDPAHERVSVGFMTSQGAQHSSREQRYRNEVISLRVGAAVGSCAIEPGEVAHDVVHDCVGAAIGDLLAHPAAPVRIAALDAYLMSAYPHEHSTSDVVTVGSGDSLAKSLARAEAVVDLVDVPPGGRVLVIGVVNSLLHHFRRRGIGYVPCDRKSGRTEWDEAVHTDAGELIDDCDAVLASGMTVGNGSFEPLLSHASRTGKPLVLFAQTASAILPWFIGSGVTAVSAEPYPFFWLSGGPTQIYRYRCARPTRKDPS